VATKIDHFQGAAAAISAGAVNLGEADVSSQLTYSTKILKIKNSWCNKIADFVARWHPSSVR
jgi:hypothetical protein